MKRFLTSEYYGNKSLLRITSRIQLISSLLLTLLPVYYNYVFNFTLVLFSNSINHTSEINLAKHIGFGFSILIAVSSTLTLVKEYLLSDKKVVEKDFQKEHVQFILNLLMDAYKWKGTCRATFFRPDKKGDKIQIYERISAGIGAGKFNTDKCFFRMCQGLPGKAWEKVWSGDRDDTLVKAMQLGSVPQKELNTPQKRRKYFRDVFNIKDDDIYNSLGEAKSRIQSYMSIGISGRNQELIGVLSIDSEEQEKFIDFEQIRNAVLNDGLVGSQTKETTIEVHGQTNGEDFGEELKNLPLPKEKIDALTPLIRDPNLLRKKISNADIDEAKEILYSVQFHKQTLMQTGKLIKPDDIQNFLFPLNWALKQLRDFFVHEY